MTEISPLRDRDMADHYLRMFAEADIARLHHQMRTGFSILALVMAAAVAGYLLGAADATARALPALIAEAHTRAAW